MERVVLAHVLAHASPVLLKAVTTTEAANPSPQGTLLRVLIGDYTEKQVDAFLSLLNVGSSSIVSFTEQVRLHDREDVSRVALLALPLLREYRCSGVLSLLKQIVLLSVPDSTSSSPSSLPLFPLVDALLRSDEDRDWAAGRVMRVEWEGILNRSESKNDDEPTRLKAVKARLEGVDTDLMARLLLSQGTIPPPPPLTKVPTPG